MLFTEEVLTRRVVAIERTVRWVRVDAQTFVREFTYRLRIHAELRLAPKVVPWEEEV